MNVREWLNNNSAIVTVVAVLVLCFALAFIIWNSSSNNRRYGPIDVYFVDLNTSEIFVARSDQIPPIAAPSDNDGGKSGVRAHIFACGDCPSGLRGRTIDELADNEVFVAYLERYTDEAQSLLSGDMQPEDEERYYMAMEMGQLVTAPGSSNWVSMNSERGYMLMSRSSERCGSGVVPSLCRP